MLFLGTAEAGDPEMAARIKSHKAESSQRIGDTLEEPLEIALLPCLPSCGWQLRRIVILECRNSLGQQPHAE